MFPTSSSHNKSNKQQFYINIEYKTFWKTFRSLAIVFYFCVWKCLFDTNMYTYFVKYD